MLKVYFRWLLVTAFLALALPLVTIVCTRLITDHAGLPAGFILQAVVLGAGLGVLFIGGVWVVCRMGGVLDQLAARQAEYLDGLDVRWVSWGIFASAAVSLYFELVMIRWQACLFALFAFYKNMGLLSCFAGLGLGYALSGRKRIPLVWAGPLIAGQAVLLMVLRFWGEGLRSRSLMASPVVEQLNMEFATAAGWPTYVAIYTFLVTTFLLTVLTFVPVGQVCGRLMARRENLTAYGLNLLGSLAGVVLSFGVAYLWTPPAVWFGLVFGGLLLFQGFSKRALSITAVSGAVALSALLWPVMGDIEQVYSPYQVVARKGTGHGMKIMASGIHYQEALDLRDSNPEVAVTPYYRAFKGYYEAPYRVHGAVHSAVIVGAGTGNDVAGALRMGVERVDAIEIDPAILHIGHEHHAEKPYDDPRTHAIVNDARSYFRTTKERYDAVVYGFLDSHALLSTASNIRVDSYVYTVEGIREARACLNPHGLLSLTFNILSPELGRKMYLMMEEAFDGHGPVCIRSKASDYGAVTFLQRREGDLAVDPATVAAMGFEECSALYADTSLTADVSTDDWPFLYIPKRVYPVSYLGMILQVGLLSLLLIGSFSESRPAAHQLPFLFLGAGFMLIETKGITELGLTFGNTWQVIGIVVSGILLMAFAANALVQRLSVSRPIVPFVLLLTCLVLGYASVRLGGFPPTTLGRVLATLTLSSPVLFSGLLFSALLRSAEDIGAAMSANLLGAILGGLLEYNSMYFGFQSLYILAGVLYAGAMISHRLWPMPGRLSGV